MLSLFFLSVGVRGRNGKKRVRKGVSGDHRLWCLFSQLRSWMYLQKLQHDFYSSVGIWQKRNVVNWRIFLFLFPTHPVLSSFPYILWNSLWAPSVPEAPSSGLFCSQCLTLAGLIVLLSASLSPERPGITLSLGFHNLSVTVFMSLLPYYTVSSSVGGDRPYSSGYPTSNKRWINRRVLFLCLVADTPWSVSVAAKSLSFDG